MLAANSRPKTITVILAMLVLLALVSATSSLTSRIGFRTPNRQFGNTGGGTGQGTNGNFQGNNGNFQGNDGASQGNFTNRRNTGFNLFSITRSLGLSPVVIFYFNLAMPILGIVLLLTSLYGIWKLKIWGLNLATLLALVFLAGAVPGFFSVGGRNINWLRISLNAISAVASLPILALSLLPSVRDYFPKKTQKARAR